MGKQISLQVIIDCVLDQIKMYGLKKISILEYQNVYRKLLSLAQKRKVDYYSKNFVESFLLREEKRFRNKDICLEYFRFNKRAVRLLTSYAETGTVDFSHASDKFKRYVPSRDSLDLIKNILDSYNLSHSSRTELDTVMRHFFCYVEDNGSAKSDITDDDFLNFMISVASITNSGSIGRTLRGLRYVHDYLKTNFTIDLKADYSMLHFKNEKIKIIPPFSQNEISLLLKAIASSNSLTALRDSALLLLGFNTGLRASDIRKLKMTDINWKNAYITVQQSKTGQVITLPLRGTAMNALADYILKERPDCEFSEIFITSRAPHRPLKSSSAFTQVITKYSQLAGIEKKPLRGFHSLRRSFATELSSEGVPLDMISQMLGHKNIAEARPYLSYDKEKISFCALDFSDIPIRYGIYHDLFKVSLQKGGRSK